MEELRLALRWGWFVCFRIVGITLHRLWSNIYCFYSKIFVSLIVSLFYAYHIYSTIASISGYIVVVAIACCWYVKYCFVAAIMLFSFPNDLFVYGTYIHTYLHTCSFQIFSLLLQLLLLLSLLLFKLSLSAFYLLPSTFDNFLLGALSMLPQFSAENRWFSSATWIWSAVMFEIARLSHSNINNNNNNDNNNCMSSNASSDHGNKLVVA